MSSTTSGSLHLDPAWRSSALSLARLGCAIGSGLWLISNWAADTKESLTVKCRSESSHCVDARQFTGAFLAFSSMAAVMACVVAADLLGACRSLLQAAFLGGRGQVGLGMMSGPMSMAAAGSGRHRSIAGKQMGASMGGLLTRTLDNIAGFIRMAVEALSYALLSPDALSCYALVMMAISGGRVVRWMHDPEVVGEVVMVVPVMKKVVVPLELTGCGDGTCMRG